MYDKFERETALATYLILHNVDMTIKIWGDWIKQEGPDSLSPYQKGLLTRMRGNIDKIEEVFRSKGISKENSISFIRKIADYYIDSRGEFCYLFKKKFIDTLNSTLPNSTFGDSFLSLMVAFHYLDTRLVKTIERVGKLEEYQRFKVALEQWVKFYKQARIIYSEEWIREILEEQWQSS